MYIHELVMTKAYIQNDTKDQLQRLFSSVSNSLSHVFISLLAGRGISLKMLCIVTKYSMHQLDDRAIRFCANFRPVNSMLARDLKHRVRLLISYCLTKERVPMVRRANLGVNVPWKMIGYAEPVASSCCIAFSWAGSSSES